MSAEIKLRTRAFYFVGALIHTALAGSIGSAWGLPLPVILLIFYCGAVTAYALRKADGD